MHKLADGRLVQKRINSMQQQVSSSADVANQFKDSYIRNAKVDLTQYFDGDTFTCILDLGCGVSKIERVRLAAVNAPELYGALKFKGLEAKKRLGELLANATEITVKTIKPVKFSDKAYYDGFGRYLAIVYADGVNLNELLLKEGYVKPIKGA